jgi:hypothetical protein
MISTLKLAIGMALPIAAGNNSYRHVTLHAVEMELLTHRGNDLRITSRSQ